MIAQRATSTPASLPAPVGGWNARDALADMDKNDAVIMSNWFPMPSYVSLRQGMEHYATGFAGQVNTVMTYNSGGTSKMFAACGANIFDISAAGAIGTAVVTTLTSDKLLHINISTPGGNFLLAVNGADKLRGCNGSAWWTDGDGAHDITGFDTSHASNIYLAKQRVWLIERNTLKTWYLPVQSIAGAATAIDFGSLCRHGGYLVAMAEWTTTGGFGMRDSVAFITSQGEILVYTGSDPSLATTWALEGIYHIGSPMGPKAFCKAGTDLLLISKEGLQSLNQGKFYADTSATKGALTDKIQWAISSATSAYAGNWGWQIQPFPLQNALILNIPAGSNVQHQFVMNTVTGSWCDFSGWPANCWEMYKDEIYFGANGYVGRAWTGNDDAGSQIVGDCQQAFNYFQAPGLLKRWMMMRPIISASGQPQILANINVDFDSTSPTFTLSAISNSNTSWDSSVWDVSIWSGGRNIYKQWQGITGIGYCAAPRLIAAGLGVAIDWMSTDLVMERGAIL